MNSTVKLIIKIAVAAAALAGIIYLIAIYGNRLSTWAKEVLGRSKKKSNVFLFEDEAAEEGALVAEENDFEG